MSNSSLAYTFIPATNYSKGRDGRTIQKITIHHMAGVLSAEQCGKIFQGNRKASSHYGIGNDGRIAQYVDESNTAWADGNWDSNCKSVTIETSNNATSGNWTVSDSALNSLIRLVADIAQRNNLGRLVKGQNVTWHRMYASTTCPGEYLLSKMDYIVSEANKLNKGGEGPDIPAGESYTVTITTDVLRIRAGAGTNYKQVGSVKRGEIYTIVETQGNWGRLKSGAGWICLDYTSRGGKPTTGRNTVGQIKVLKDNVKLWSNPNLTGTSYSYLKGTRVEVLENVNNDVDKVYVPATGRTAYINIYWYK